MCFPKVSSVNFLVKKSLVCGVSGEGYSVPGCGKGKVKIMGKE